MRLKSLVATAITMALTAPAWAGPHNPPRCDDFRCPPPPHGVPEISSNGALAALIVVAALAAILWERRRRA
jgi:hypothetical protein